MENRYRTNWKKVYLSDQELIILNKNLAQSQCPSFSHYARKTLLDPGMNFITIDTSGFQELIFEIRRIGNNINQIARVVNQSHLISLHQIKELQLGVVELEKQLQQDFDIKCQRLREFYGHN
ncbi:TPA: MobC family plasmid mobilization relaxosome protein [Streptococcus agalactiae]|nr:MobC family plasmid mobilization relaxosome protein [Streptococcus agalactiae]